MPGTFWGFCENQSESARIQGEIETSKKQKHTCSEVGSLLLRVFPTSLLQSGREDLNLRPPQPHCGALPGCATPRYWNNSSIAEKLARSQGFMATDHSTKYARNCCTFANQCSRALAA